MEVSEKKLIRPLYLNICICGQVNTCPICRSKYHRKYNTRMTEKEKEDHRHYARIKYQNMNDDKKAQYREKAKSYYASLTPEKKRQNLKRERERTSERRKQREQRTCK